jgi:rod shape determining protein RodA
LYAFVLFGLLFLQPDFGTAIVIAAIWLGMVLVAGIRIRHLALVFGIGALTLGLLWQFGFADYQKERIVTFLNPLSDIQGAGYNAYQSTVAAGSGQLWGKGIGFGTQSKLQFLPEYETDFIFAAFAEEWGFVGAIGVLVLFGIVLWRILALAFVGATNFESLFACGFAIMLLAHCIIHIGMNIGLLPVTGLTLPFMSYGGSHLLTEFIGLGILASMRRYRRTVPRDQADREFVGGM